MDRGVSGDSIVVAVRDQVSTDIDEETVILNLKSGMYYGLDSVGTYVWNLIQQPMSVLEVRNSVLERFDVDAEQCEQDVSALLDELVGKGLAAVVHEHDQNTQTSLSE